MQKKVHRRESFKKCVPQERNPWTPKFEKKNEERRARRDAWELAHDVLTLKKVEIFTFYSPAEAWVMLAPSSTKPEERHFVIDSGPSIQL